MLMAPEMGSALTGCQVIYLKPGDTYQVHLHPVAEAVIVVFRGAGEVYLGDFWYEVSRGDVIYVPENVKHGLRNSSAGPGDFICYYWQVPYLADFKNLPGAEDELFEAQAGPVIKRDARGKFDTRIPGTGYIGNVNEGALFTGYGAEMLFIIWPGMGSRKITLHRAKHPPGFEFRVHVHPDSEDTVLAFGGSGQGFLVDRWYDMEEGDVMFAPRQVKHGTRKPPGRGGEVFIATGSAAPPQMELYRLGGYL
jgi:quercetin dioxygenase-like cupin family protein